RRLSPRVQDNRLLAAGGLAIVSAALLFLGLFPAYIDGHALASDYENNWYAADNIWYAVIVAVLASTAAVCSFVPRTRRLVGPGLLLGTVAASTWLLLFVVVASLDYDLNAGAGYQLWLAAHLLLVLAGGLAGLALVRVGGARLGAGGSPGAGPRVAGPPRGGGG